MTKIQFSDQDLERVLDPRTSREERKAAFMRAMEQAWSLGWDACQEETDRAMGKFLARDYGIPQ